MIITAVQDIPYLFDPVNWNLSTPGSIPALLTEHLFYTVLAVAIGSLIAIPVGLYIGHTGRFAFIAINAGNVGRSLPTLGVISLLVVLIGLGLVPVMIALVLLVLPPLLTSTYAGIRAVDPNAVDAAKGMGMRSTQILTKVEIPIALPLIFAGLRGAILQVVSTATVAAYVGLGGLGRLLLDGLTLNQYDRVMAGAFLVAALAIVLDLLSEQLQRVVVSPGVARAQRARRPRKNVETLSTTAVSVVD